MDKFEIKQYRKYSEDEILPLYKSVGWDAYSNNPLMIKNAFENSLVILAAYIDGEVVGILRAVGDGYSILYIQDIIVLPTHQRKGIGSELLKSILGKYNYVYQKVLLTDNKPETIAFYKKAGFYLDLDMECAAFVKFAKV